MLKILDNELFPYKRSYFKPFCLPAKMVAKTVIASIRSATLEVPVHHTTSLITNTAYRQPNRNKTSWMHPRSKHWHLIDYIIVRRRDRCDVRVTKAMCGADCWTDHRLILSKVNLHVQTQEAPTRENSEQATKTSKIDRQAVRQNLVQDLDTKLSQLDLGANGAEEGLGSFQGYGV